MGIQKPVGRLGEQDNAKKISKTRYFVHVNSLTLDISGLNVISYCKRIKWFCWSAYKVKRKETMYICAN